MDVPAALDTQWYDGRSPRPRAVTLRVEAGELLMHIGEEVRRYPVARVRWPERRTHGQRQAELPDGGLIQHADAAAWDTWARASGLRDGAVAGWMQSWRAALAALAGSAAFLAAAWFWGVPWLGAMLAHQVPASLENRIGQHSLQQLGRLFLRPSQLPPAQQDDLRQRFGSLVERAHPQGDAPHWELAFHASPALGANAFALPGGHIVMTDELVKLLQDQPDALVGVLAHELGHVQNRDGLDMVVRAGLASALVGVVLGDASGFIASVPATLATQAYSRDTERRADAYAADLLDRGGIPPAVMEVFFERIRRAAPSGARKDGAPRADLPIAIASHPSDEERIRFFRDWRRPAR